MEVTLPELVVVVLLKLIKVLFCTPPHSPSVFLVLLCVLAHQGAQLSLHCVLLWLYVKLHKPSKCVCCGENSTGIWGEEGASKQENQS